MAFSSISVVVNSTRFDESFGQPGANELLTSEVVLGDQILVGAVDDDVDAGGDQSGDRVHVEGAGHPLLGDHVPLLVDDDDAVIDTGEYRQHRDVGI